MPFTTSGRTSVESMRSRARSHVFVLGFTVLFALFAGACSGAEDAGAPPSDLGDETADAAQEADVPGSEGTVDTKPEQQTEPDETSSLEEDEPRSVDLPAVDPVVFQDDFSASIMPIFENRCASCHQVGGPGTAHWTLDTVADITANQDLIWANIEAGVMPPWPASSESVPFHADRSLRDDEVQALIDWMAADSEIDVAPDTPLTVGTELLALPRVDLEVPPETPYQGVPGTIDDYRCLVYTPEISQPMYLTGYEFVPDQTEVVHHAIGYHASSVDRERATGLAAEDDKGGWECFGGSRMRNDDMFLGWAPGQSASVYPEGSGLLLQPGDFVVVQIHYHYETDAPEDASFLRLMLEPGDVANGDDELDEINVTQYVAPAEIPCSTDESGPLCDRRAALEYAIERFGDEGVQAERINFICGVAPDRYAGMTDGSASSSCELPIYGFGEIVSVLGHMHEIGRSFRMTLNPGESDERVLLDIPRWDFDWQYNYEPVESIQVAPGDNVRIECSWDRSLIKPGSEPRYILWADGTNDEMCFSTIVTRS